MAYTPYGGSPGSSTWQPLPSQYFPTPPTALAFDPLSPLLFAANPNGTITSHFCSPDQGLGGRYTSYRGHWGPVGEMAIDQSGILSVGGGGNMPGRSGGGGSVKLANRRGMALWSVETDPPVPLTTFAYTPARSSEIVATGPGSDMIVVNLTRGSVVRQQASPLSFVHLRRAAQLVGSTITGSLAMLDTRTPEISIGETVLAHTGGISQLETEGNYIVTIGYTMRHGMPLPDPYLKLFDARYLRPLTPIPFPTPPAFVRFHPRLSGNVVVASSEGRVQMLDLKDIGKSSVFQVETPNVLTSMAISPTGEGLAFGDADGYVHLWAAQPEEGDAKFCRFEGEVELPDPVEAPERINWRDDTPLNSIGMPYYDTPLLSLLPTHMTAKHTASHRRVPIDPQVMTSAKTVDFVGYATYPPHLRSVGRRNQARTAGNSRTAGRVGVDAPMFRSERERAEAKRRRDHGEDQAKAEEEPEEEPSMDDKMPKYYRRVEIKYSRFGIEDFDFAFYNKTQYSGLETHITNSYTNSLLQALHYMQPIRTLAKSHTFEACPKENCLLCEAGFLFRMLEDAKGMNCQASNFSRAFGANPQVSALGLIDHENDATKSVAYSTLIQTFNRYLLEQMNTESTIPKSTLPQLVKGPAIVPPLPPLAQVVKLDLHSASSCQTCGAKSDRDTGVNVIDLSYPRKAMSNEPQPSTSFPSILSSSITRETIARLPCSSCKQNTHVRVRRVLPESATLPPILVVNAGVRTADELDVWRDGREGPNSRFLSGRFRMRRGPEGLAQISAEGKAREGDVEYALKASPAMVVQIQTEDEAPHLVALAKVTSEDGKPGASWHLFNDFLVKPVTEEEVLSFPGKWKIPAVLFFERVDVNSVLDLEDLPMKADPSVLCEDINISRARDRSLIKHQPFRPDELPRKGTLVAIDAEFVSLQQEEAEFHSDGTKKVLRPSRQVLARVSVLRGEGEETGIPAIDDHIHTGEPIVDYLTEFSGIRAGDLDPQHSRHTLVPLKVAYKKLRLLVDLGCIFIGHGLNKDFRIINIYVPPSQIIDTVNIYHLPQRQRKLSLRFLAYAVLHSSIQADTHDSIEDARTALQLYEHYQRLEAEGTWEDTLEEIYREGKQTNFKAPVEPPPSVARADSPGFGALGPLPMHNSHLHTHQSHPHTLAQVPLSPQQQQQQQMFVRGVFPPPPMSMPPRGPPRNFMG
ncbi:hypothetical protein B0A53_00679 [Rhodotorula sp. CCFEE 5036]|nr:hypothetical protein B0A53_00679 [Rhodotorula sp. CCFEE 5036]